MSPNPEPEAGQVLIKAQALVSTALTCTAGGRPGRGSPSRPGFQGLDVAVVVESVGADVSGWQPGDPVTALVRGAYAEYAVAGAALAYRPPAACP